MDWRERDGVKWLEAKLPRATAAFSTRIGGVSEGTFASLNLGLYTDDEPGAVLANRGRLAHSLGREPGGFLFGHQVHGAELLARDQAPDPNPFMDSTAGPPESDGQVTASTELTPLVQVADCLPVALSGEHGVAMLHCGWRGLAAGIVSRGAEAVGGTAAAIGPGIGPCCFEVGPEVTAQFDDLGDEIAAGRMLDLPEIARRLLAAAGVELVESSDLCTCCESDLFFSHRRDRGTTGRQAGVAWIDADG